MHKPEPVSTGLPGLDRILNYLRPGDNVVWQVDSVEEYCYFVCCFVEHHLALNKRIVYLRFGQHEEIVPPHVGIKVYHLNADRGFEAFSGEVHRIASSEGPGVFYIFDCLSDLLTNWATDLMIGNFFRVTCPYLFELDTIAYFAILKDRNSYETVARIRETAQVLLDLKRRDDRVFVHPLKVFNRYSPTMYLPHIKSGQDFIPISSSMEAAGLFTSFQADGPGSAGRKLDYWDRIFIKARELQIKQDGPEIKQMFEILCKMVIGVDEQVLALCRKYLTLQDLLEIHSHLIGSGFIGGKAVGMLLARKILASDKDNNWESVMEPHDSFYVGSDVYYTYLVENGCWNLRLEQKKEESYFSAAEELQDKMLQGSFPVSIREQFYRMMDYFGQSPIIVRSSSLLEDSFGNAFAGKYESEFCVNQGSLEERYKFFEQAVRTVYTSTMSKDALEYRKQRGLAASDEQMALLVQRVSGSYHQYYFFPDLAGVAMSRNPYIWREDLDARAGMMRLVLGLGTRAVDRVDDDYPRLVALDKPLLRPDYRREEIRKFSQRRVDLLDIRANTWTSMDLRRLFSLKSLVNCWKLVAVPDYEQSRALKKAGYEDSESWILSFDRLLEETPLTGIMSAMLQTLEKAYEYPVDTEFTINFLEGRMQINLLQCRPLQTLKKRDTAINTAAIHGGDIILSSRGRFMGNGPGIPLQKIIYIRLHAYINLSLQDKYQIARLIGRLNRMFKESSQAFILIGPGRWGTSTPSLGIPICFAEISNAAVLVEVAVEDGGYMPELSFGTHFFQDLVEMQILYLALYPGEKDSVFREDLIMSYPNALGQFLPEAGKWEDVIMLADLEGNKQGLYVESDLKGEELTAYLGPASE